MAESYLRSLEAFLGIFSNLAQKVGGLEREISHLRETIETQRKSQTQPPEENKDKDKGDAEDKDDKDSEKKKDEEAKPKVDLAKNSSEEPEESAPEPTPPSSQPVAQPQTPEPVRNESPSPPQRAATQKPSEGPIKTWGGRIGIGLGIMMAIAMIGVPAVAALPWFESGILLTFTVLGGGRLGQMIGQTVESLHNNQESNRAFGTAIGSWLGMAAALAVGMALGPGMLGAASWLFLSAAGSVIGSGVGEMAGAKFDTMPKQKNSSAFSSPPAESQPSQSQGRSHSRHAEKIRAQRYSAPSPITGRS